MQVGFQAMSISIKKNINDAIKQPRMYLFGDLYSSIFAVINVPVEYPFPLDLPTGDLLFRLLSSFYEETDTNQ